MSTHAEWQAQCMAAHSDERARGLHDDECEYGRQTPLERLMLCHCHKRKRERAGLTETPTDDLYFPPPSCPHCNEDVDHDGDGWVCSPCALSWANDGDGRSCTFTDEWGPGRPHFEGGGRAMKKIDQVVGGEHEEGAYDALWDAVSYDEMGDGDMDGERTLRSLTDAGWMLVRVPVADLTPRAGRGTRAPSGDCELDCVERCSGECGVVHLVEPKDGDELCGAQLCHGPGHQSTTRCEVAGPHEMHVAHFGGDDRRATWRDGHYWRELRAAEIEPDPARFPESMAMTGYNDEPPEDEDDDPKGGER